mmetsp:Transcript_80430/g.179952  ORF Transcript_80430/g.179952 Transcript_80430/m.179952 type:complete len:264 (-) Transcript_80430:187-978(-)
MSRPPLGSADGGGSLGSAGRHYQTGGGAVELAAAGSTAPGRGARSLCCEADSTLNPPSWAYVGQGNGAFSSVPVYNYVGQGGGSYAKQEVITYRVEGLRWQCICLAAAVFVLTIVLLSQPISIRQSGPALRSRSETPASGRGEDQRLGEVGSSTLEYDCDHDFAGVWTRWLPTKREYCCNAYSIGCGVPGETREPEQPVQAPPRSGPSRQAVALTASAASAQPSMVAEGGARVGTLPPPTDPAPVMDRSIPPAPTRQTPPIAG